MTAWIFQGNPDRFDIDGYLAFAPNRITWLVNQSRKEIKPGDQVFIWKARGSGRYGSAGILAEGLVDSDLLEIPEEPNAFRFWRDSFDPAPRDRVWVRVVQVAESGTTLDRTTISETLGLEKIGPIAFGNATNFKLSEDETRELNRLWYGTIKTRSAKQVAHEFEAKAAVLEKLSLQQLLNEYRRRRASADELPRRTQTTVTSFERDPSVTAIARVRAGFRCEVANCPTPSFPSISERPYCEIHHLLPLSDDGEDIIENVVCVCANHHRELHFGRRRDELTKMLRAARG
jgi:HNH endonuclease